MISQIIFFTVIGISLILLFVFAAVDAMLTLFLDCSNYSVPMACGQFIREQSAGYVDRLLWSNNISEQTQF